MNLQDAADRILARLLRRAAAFGALRRRAPGPWAADVRVVSTKVMKDLNLRHRKKGHATDVLSFASPQRFRKMGILGTLVVCGPVLRRQAKEFGQTQMRELELLIAHGLLHLLGMDHERSTQGARIMRRYEALLLRRSGMLERADG